MTDDEWENLVDAEREIGVAIMHLANAYTAMKRAGRGEMALRMNSAEREVQSVRGDVCSLLALHVKDH